MSTEEAPTIFAAAEGAAAKSEIETKFDEAVAWVGHPDNKLEGVPTERKLNLYKFYKHAKEGI